jgi:CubicO group peptidase (beta-lactamase class C family)
VFTADELQQKLSELIQAHNVPGAQLAVLDGDEIVETAAGVLSLRTNCPVTADALFLPGSIGKLYTATLIMMLVDAGELDLDATLRSYLPAFVVQDEHAAATVTLRHLLTHTSGFDGDHFTDTGRGDDALARYVDGCADLPQIADPGKFWSYSNSSYAILGRVVEVVTGQTFEDALRERIFNPLALEHTVSFAEQAIAHPVSVGHVEDPENPGRLVVSPTWGLYRAFGPMGSAVVASAGDVLRFVSLHVDGGRELLDSELVSSMQQEHVRLVDDSLLGGSWGLGWNLDRWGDHRIIGHDGNSIGQNAFMRVAPDARFGFCLQTNVGSALSLYLEVARWLYGERLGVAPRPDPSALDDAAVADSERYAGTYEREGLRVEVTPTEEKQLVATLLSTRDVEGLSFPPMENLPLRPVDRKDSFFLKVPVADADLLAVFFNPDHEDGPPTYMHYGGRAARRKTPA